MRFTKKKPPRVYVLNRAEIIFYLYGGFSHHHRTSLTRNSCFAHSACTINSSSLINETKATSQSCAEEGVAVKLTTLKAISTDYQTNQSFTEAVLLWFWTEAVWLRPPRLKSSINAASALAKGTVWKLRGTKTWRDWACLSLCSSWCSQLARVSSTNTLWLSHCTTVVQIMIWQTSFGKDAYKSYKTLYRIWSTKRLK